MIDYKELYSVCGAIPSPIDERDYPLTNIIPMASNPPRKFSIKVDKSAILDQGQVGCCVACSLALTRHLKEKEQSNDDKLFSPMYIYGNREDGDCQDEGMFPREALRTLKNFGVCYKEDFDGYMEYPKAKKEYLADKTRKDQLAYPNRISSYYRLYDKLDIVNAISTLGAVTICIPVYELLYYPKNDYVEYDKNDTYIRGYHEVTLVGYDIDEHYYEMANSWDIKYGTDGVVRLSMDYPIEEAWIAIDEVTEKKFINK